MVATPRFGQATKVRKPRTSHDQRFKTLFKSCLDHLIRITHPGIARRLRFDRCEFLDKETFTDVIGGEQKVMDLVAKLPTTDGDQRIVLVLLETEEKNRQPGKVSFDQRIAEYVMTLWLRYHLPVLPIVIWFAPNHGGIGKGRFRLKALGEAVIDVHYRRVGVRDLSAEKYLKGRNPLGHALAIRMKREGLSKVDLRLLCERKLVKDRVGDHIRYLLLSCISSYAGLNPSQMKEYQKKLARPENKEIVTMHLDSEERGIKKGLKQGREQGLQKGLEHLQLAVGRAFVIRFGELPESLLLRLKKVKDLQSLNDLHEVVLTAPDRAHAEAQLDHLLP